MADDADQNDTSDNLPSGWTPEMLQFRAEQASLGGVCAITVGNLVVLAEQLESDPKSRSHKIKEIFRDGRMLSIHSGNTPKKRRKQDPEVASFYPLSDPIILKQSKADVEFGVYKNTVGLLICGEKFVPLIRLVKFTQPRTNVPNTGVTPQCSYAELNVRVLNLSGDEIVITSEDEEKGLIAILSEDLTYHVTHEVLRSIQDCFETDHEIPLDDRIAKINSMLNFEEITYKALNITPGTDIEKEIQIRRAVEVLREGSTPGEQILLFSKKVKNKKDPSCDSVQETFLSFNTDGSFSLCETISFPKLPDPAPQIIANISFKNEVGIVIYQGDNLIKPTYDQIIAYSHNLVGFDRDLLRNVSANDPLDRRERLTHHNRSRQFNRSLKDKALDAVEAVFETEIAARELVVIGKGESLPELSECVGKTYQIRSTDGSEKAYKFADDKVLINLALSLSGIDGERAERLRTTILDLAKSFEDATLRSSIERAVLESYAGIDSEAAWDYRRRFLEKNSMGYEQNVRSLSISLIGLSSQRIDSFLWFEPRRMGSKKIPINFVGHDDERSMKTRTSYLAQDREASLRIILESLAGVEGDEAEKMRRELSKEMQGLDKKEVSKLPESKRHHAKKSRVHDTNLAIARSLIGIDTFSASRLRRGLDSKAKLISHTGSDSRSAWKIRDEELCFTSSREQLALSLAGLTSERAEKMRRDIAATFSHGEKDVPDFPSLGASVIARSYMGDIYGLVQRLGGLGEVDGDRLFEPPEPVDMVELPHIFKSLRRMVPRSSLTPDTGPSTAK